MKDRTTKEYSMVIYGHEYTFTAHTNKERARATITENLYPCLVEMVVDGTIMYDAFPLGHPIPTDARIIERCELTSSGSRWKPVRTISPEGAR
jgi:hypothetical protein